VPGTVAAIHDSAGKVSGDATAPAAVLAHCHDADNGSTRSVVQERILAIWTLR
jgi:hypothetical protein